MLIKRIVSILIALTVIFSAFASVPVTTVAAQQEIPPLESTGDICYSAGDRNYCIWNSYKSFNGTVVGGANYGEDNQSVSDMKATRCIRKQIAPYCAWIVDAPEDGMYRFNPVYSVGGTYTSYNMVIGVNDEFYYTGIDITPENGSWVGEGVDVYSLHLTKGRNVIRMLTTACESYVSTLYVDVASMFMDRRLTVIPVNELNLEACEAPYINRWDVNQNGYLCNAGAYLGNAISENLTIDSLHAGNLDKVPYFSYTFNVPTSGYYDIDLWAGIGGYAKEGNGYFVARVGNKNYGCDFYNAKEGNNLHNLTVYLEQGVQTLTITSAFEVSSYNGSFATWCDVDNMVIRGGVTVAETAVDPLTISDPKALATKYYEAENAYLHFYKKVSSTAAHYSNGGFAGGANYGNSISESALTNLFSQDISYVAFAVEAPSTGKYYISPRFAFGCKDNSQDKYDEFIKKYNSNPYVMLLVNGNEAYKVEHIPYCGWTNTSDFIEVTLNEGTNIIYALTPTTEVAREFEGVYVDYDALVIDNRLSISNAKLFVPGDCNGDGYVDLLDILRLKSYIADNRVEIHLDEANLDLDENRFIGSGDLVTMVKRIMEPKLVSNLSLLNIKGENKERLQSEVYGILNRYNTIASTHIGDMAPDSNGAPSYSDMVSKGYFEKSQLPYVSYMVNVPAAGEYELTVKYDLAMNEGYSANDYYMVITTNDKNFYKSYFSGTDNGTSSSSSIAKINVTLDKGVNVVRCISAVAETYPSLNWLDHDFIEFKGDVTPIKPQTTYLQSGEASYIYNFGATRTYDFNEAKTAVVNCNPYTAKSLGITYDNLSQANVSKMPSFSYTVDVPADGYYDIDVAYNATHTEMGTEGYFAMMVDGVKHKVYFNNPNSYIQYNKANASTYLTKGTHTVIITSCFGWGGVDPSYRDWFDMGALVVHGGIVKSAYQKSPVYTRLESETYGIAHRYATTAATHIGDVQLDSNNAQSYSSIINEGYIEKSQLPYVAYMVNVPSAGDYQLELRYNLAVNSGKNASDYYMVVSVNDKRYYQNYFNAESAGSTYNLSRQTVYLDAGVNVIRCITAVAETYPIVSWLDHDYIQINAEVSPVAPQTTYLYAGDSSYITNYGTRGTSGNLPSKSYIGGANASKAKAAGVTYDNLSQYNLFRTPSFSYTVTVPANGYYDIDLYYNVTNSASETGKKGYFAMMIDGSKSRIYFNNPNVTINLNKANASAYLTAGTHTIAITSCFGFNGSDPCYRDWSDFGALIVHGGMAKASSQKCAYEAAQYIELDVPLYGQQTSYTCGSASGSMILNSLGYNISESTFWNTANSGGQGTYVYMMRYTLNYYIGSSVYKEVLTTSMSLDSFYNRIRTSLLNGYPVQIVIKIPSGSPFGYSSSGHYVVIRGLYKDANGNYIAMINDPYSKYGTNSPQKIEINLSTLKTYNSNHSGYIVTY